MAYINHKRKAFTMLELIFVIVILGIVSSIGSEIIANVYKSYILERATHRSSVKTELAATQLANRLLYSVPGTVIGRKTSDYDSYRDISNLDSEDYDILEWVAYDNDSFSANITPGWSGFVDLKDSNATHLMTRGSNLDTANTIIQSLTNNDTSIGDTAVFFPGQYNAYNIGYTDGGDSSGAIKVDASSTGNDLVVEDLTGKTISEFYKLSWTACALVPTTNADGTSDLVLYYDYQPWRGEKYTDDVAKHQVLVRNVTVFKFVGSDNTIRFKVCQKEKITNDKSITICKEKAVIR